jgi:hypothetical protein
MRRIGWKSKTILVRKDDVSLDSLLPAEHYAMNVATIDHKLASWMANIRANLPRIVQADLEIPERRGPAIVVGGSNPATPLLDRNKRWLARWQGHVFACDRAVPQIVDIRVPDVIVVLESNHEPNYRWIMDYERVLADHGTELWCPPIVDPSLAKNYPGTVRWFHVQYPDEIENFSRFMFYLLPPMYVFWTGGNVGLTTWFAAVGRGCRPVALIGMDLSEDKGEHLETTTLMRQWAVALRNGILSMREKGVETFECTEGGLLWQEGCVPRMTLQEFVKRWEDGSASG